MSEPLFLTIEQVQSLLRLALERHGGQDGIRDAATLESAVLQPCNLWLYSKGDLFELAAAYAFHLAEAQAFVDGNKRTGMGAALVFLESNGITVPEATDELCEAMIAVAERRPDKTGVAELLRELCAGP